MEQYEQITLDMWMQWKEDIRQKLAETAGNFVHIGYRLKQIRDSGMFDGAGDIFEFAEREYGLGKSTVSRFIAINEKYSEGGNSLYLREEYRNFSSSKLSEMLTLPDADCQLITEKTTIKEIRELKNFGRQQAAGEHRNQEPQHTPLEKCIIDFFREKRELLGHVMDLLRKEEPGYREAAELINPSGQCSHKKGLIFLFFYDWVTGIKYKLMGQPEPVSMTWPELLNEVYKIYEQSGIPDVWEEFYGETGQEDEPQAAVLEAVDAQSGPGIETSVATSQQGEEKDEDPEDDIQENEEDDTNGEINADTRNAEGEMQESEQKEEPEYSDGYPAEPDVCAEDPEQSGNSSVIDIAESADVEGDVGHTEVPAAGTPEDMADQAEGQMDIMQLEEYIPETGTAGPEADAYMDALRDILDNIYAQTETQQYSYAEELLEAARGTIRKIASVCAIDGK